MENLLEEAKKAYQEKNYEKAIGIWSSEDLKESEDAKYNMGLMYIQGTGVTRDASLAVEWFESAGEKHTSALYNLGLIFQNAISVERDEPRAYEYYLKSAELGHSDSMYEVAQYALFNKSQTVPANPKIGFEALITASESNHKRAKMQLKMVCPNYFPLDKIPVPKDLNKDFRSLSNEEQMQKVDEILTKDVRDVLKADGGDISIVDLKNGDIIDLRLKYQGNCSGCSLASTSTLELIKSKLHQEIDEGVRVLAL